jgi:hypothetical protein
VVLPHYLQLMIAFFSTGGDWPLQKQRSFHFLMYNSLR